MTTLIHKAAKWGKPELLRRLLATGGDVNAVDTLGYTPLDYAIKFGNFELAEFLTRAGAKSTDHKTDKKRSKNDLILSKADSSADNKYTGILEMITEGIASQDTPRNDLINFIHKSPTIINNKVLGQGKTLLHIAAEKGKLSIVQWLVARGASPLELDSNGCRPHELARTNGFYQVSEYLVERATQQPQPEHISQSLASTIEPYIDNGDGTVTDTHTELVWMRCVLGQQWNGQVCIGEAKKYNLDEALSLQRSFAGHNDWHVPTIDELSTILNKNRRSPAIDTDVFPNTPSSSFWSSSPSADVPELAWQASHYDGHINLCPRYLSRHVRLVRHKNPLIGNSNNLENLAYADTVLQKRLDQLEHRFEAAINQINTTIASLRTDQLTIKESINQLHQISNTKINELTTELISLQRGMVAAETLSYTPTSKIFHHIDDISDPDATTPANITLFAIWLINQNSIPLLELRARLLPIDLLPNAVIDDINERALDLTGEPALEEDGDNVIVRREILLQVIDAWQDETS